jgi:hypothetical protein
MAVKRKFKFPMSTLLYEGDLIITTTEGQAAFATKRLRDKFVPAARTKLVELGGKGVAKQTQAAQTGDLTQEQNDSIARMLELFGNAKDSAKRAFPGQDVKLRQEFKIGVNDPNDLGSILDRAKIVLASAKTAANAAALKEKGGWVATDTTEFEAVIKQVGDIDKAQQESQRIAITGTDDRNTAANSLYDDLLTIQNAANIEWPASNANNRGTRDAFRLGSFPPAGGSAQPPASPPPAPPKPNP